MLAQPAHAHNSILACMGFFDIIRPIHSLHILVQAKMSTTGRAAGNHIRAAFYQRIIMAAFILTHCPMAAAQRLRALLRQQRIRSDKHLCQHSVIIGIADIALGDSLSQR